jgi:hypothetical protein
LLQAPLFTKFKELNLIPSIDRFWIQEQESVISQFRDQEVILLCLYFLHVLHFSKGCNIAFLCRCKNSLHNGLIIIILMSGDIAINPGPIKFPCGQCGKSVSSNQRAIQCEECLFWQHIKCIGLPLKEYDRLSNL